MFDFVQTGVAALRSGRNKGNVRYANDEEGFGGAALSNTTLASEDEDEEEKTKMTRTRTKRKRKNSERRGRRGCEMKRKTLEARINAQRRSNASRHLTVRTTKKERELWLVLQETKKEKDEVIESALAKISAEDLEKAKKEAKNLNFTVGSGAYVALVVLLAGKAVGIPSMSPATIEKFARQLGLEGKTKNGKKTKMGSFYD